MPKSLSVTNCTNVLVATGCGCSLRCSWPVAVKNGTPTRRLWSGWRSVENMATPFNRGDTGINTAEGQISGPRAARLAKQRQQDQQDYESKRQKIQVRQKSYSQGGATVAVVVCALCQNQDIVFSCGGSRGARVYVCVFCVPSKPALRNRLKASPSIIATPGVTR